MDNGIIKRIKNGWTILVGNPEEFTLESLIFHSFSCFVFFALIIETCFNLVVHLHISLIITIIIWGVQLFAYYLSRFKRQLNIAIVISGIEINVFLAINYVFNSGIAGATLLMFGISLFTLLSVAPKKQWTSWLVVNVTSVLFVLLLEYFRPDVIRHYYTSRIGLFSDHITSYLTAVTLLFVGTSLIRRSYIKQKESADEKALALEKLNAEKNKLFSIISHDLRSPLASVQQYLELITQVEIDPQEKVVMERELLTRIGDTQGLLTNLLNWSKSQMEGETLKPQRVSIKELLQKMSNVFVMVAGQKGIEFKTYVDEEIIVTADIDMLRLVLRNLINNAVKFTLSGGNIELSAKIENGNCIISVKDDGLGIPLSKQKDIFSLKIESTSGTKNEKGTGLGLNLCAYYTKLQGGKIWFTSEEKKGSSFYVSLPVATA